ncbi:MAG: thiolase family protein [Syntrophomonadaceae bacterium]|jgi:acetyl-CoA C-acetyltransferase|nr:thiolase family protein [Syntrophomonadaceae bacterium]
MQDVVIASAVRTPIGIYMGSLADQRSQDLAAVSMKAAIAGAGIDSSHVDICIYSEAKQSSFPANIGRHGWLLAGLAENTAGFTMNTLCAGAIQTMISAYSKIIAGEYTTIMTGGIETNSQAQHYLVHPRYKFGRENACFYDSKEEVEKNAQPVNKYGELMNADIADIIAGNYDFHREQIVEYAFKSKLKARNAIKSGLFKEAIVPVLKKVKKTEVTIDIDDGAAEASLSTLLAEPVINRDGTATVGNIAPLADGSASILMLAGDKAKELGCKTMGKVAGFGIAAGHPVCIEKTTIKSIDKALKFASLTLKDIDFIDLHEPSGAYALAVTTQLGSDAADKINVDGGSLGFGHAGAATGGFMVVNMVRRLQRTGAHYGLVNVGALGGQSLSIIITA